MSLIAWYKLDNDAKDSSGNNRHGSPLSHVKWSPDGKVGGCARFTGLDTESIIIGVGSHIFPLPNFSISIWLKTPGPATGISQNGFLSLTYSLTFHLNPDGDLHFRGAGGSHFIPLGWNDNQWHHLVVSYDGNTKRVHGDGELLWEENASWDGNTNHPDSQVLIGREMNASGRGFNGLIDDVRIYDHALSEKEIKELSRAKILHYKFDDFQESTRNLLSNSDEPITSSSYNIKDYPLKTPLVEGKTYTVSMKATLGEGKSYFGLYNSGGSVSPTLLSNSHLGSDGIYRRTFTWSVGSSSNTFLRVYHMPSSAVVESTIEWIQVEEKEKVTPFTPDVRIDTIHDSSGYDNHAILNIDTSPSWTSDSALGSGAYDIGASQDSRGFIIDVTSVGLKMKDESISFWMKCDMPRAESEGGSFGNRIIQWGSYYENNSGGIGLHSGFVVRYLKGSTSSGWSNSGSLGASANSIYDTGGWIHYVVVFEGDNRIRVHMNGANVWSGSISDPYTGYTTNTIELGRQVLAKIDDVRLYATALSDEDIKEIYRNRASIDKKGNLYVPEVVETGHRPLIADYTLWQDGQTGSIGAFSRNGTDNENYRVLGYDPWGKETVIWEARPSGDATSDGGWNMNHTPIDVTKTYRYSVWAKRSVQGDGSFYLGTMANNVARIATGETDANPYFFSGSGTATIDSEWQLYVAHVHPYNYEGGIHPDSGRYKLNGRVGNIAREFRWLETATRGRHRSYLYYSSDTTTRQQWCYPRVDICDGTEPSIQDLLNGFDSRYIEYVRKKGGSNPVTLDIQRRHTIAGNISEVGLPVRYIRDWSNGSTVNTGNHWVEIEAYSNGINVALGKSATSPMLTDGAIASSPYYAAGSGKASVQVDLGDVYTIDTVNIRHYYSDRRTYHETKTEVSADGVNWVTIFDSSKEGEYPESPEGHTIICRPQKVRLDLDGNLFVGEIVET